MVIRIFKLSNVVKMFVVMIKFLLLVVLIENVYMYKSLKFYKRNYLKIFICK